MSQRLIKLASSLQMKKYREREQLFVAEGTKLVESLIEQGLETREILCTEQWAEEHNSLSCTVLSAIQLKRASNLKTASQVVALFEIPQRIRSIEYPVLLLDCIQDPGNLGTIIRTGAWFGIKTICCSLDTVDCYSPKVVQATMGALTMVDIQYRELEEVVQNMKKEGVKVYGTFLGGDDLYTASFSEKTAVVIGNEGRGISEDVARHIDSRITIPSPVEVHPESLNASISAGVICSEIFRKIAKG